MPDYYSQKLSAQRLKLCYDIAQPRIRQYLTAEIAFAKSRIKLTDNVLELGCGYGRVMKKIAPAARLTVGVDTSLESLRMGLDYLRSAPRCHLLCMDAGQTGFVSRSFNVVLCLQNGISAFKVDPLELVSEAARLLRPGGRALFSSYSEKIWKERLEWFRLQAEHGCLGEIDEEKTGNGIIVCKDGFRATTYGPGDFRGLCERLELSCRLEEVDESSLFCEIFPP